ncbi:MAG: 16S rRNA (guanine(966)-N(2))-methyltransferase RsmD [Clostridiales bacterium]|jgi:16S rRNA (guanine966-N2)-methyltransferase|nr:16S rRNA (guanine(966)-N(2))-methyltransferase RsmD [Clostridiales bacterium]
MRVVSGLARGHKLKTIDGEAVRPTIDRVKEAVFSSVSDMVYGCNFLDLFSGSGAIGIEALSRQAKSVYFVDNDSHHVQVINENIEHVKKAVLSGGADVSYSVMNTDAFSALDRLSEKGVIFDIIFLDPPFCSNLIAPSIKRIYENNMLSKGGVIIAETGQDEDLNNFKYVNILKMRNYGKISVIYIDFI